jgi:hypothetical protein
LKPHVDFVIEDDPDEPAYIGIAVINAGPEPTLIKSVDCFVVLEERWSSGLKTQCGAVDDAKAKDADAVATAVHLSCVQLVDRNFDPGDSLAVKETVWLLKYRKPHDGNADPMEAERFTEFLDDRLVAMFCSVVDEAECQFQCSTSGSAATCRRAELTCLAARQGTTLSRPVQIMSILLSRHCVEHHLWGSVVWTAVSGTRGATTTELPWGSFNRTTLVDRWTTATIPLMPASSAVAMISERTGTFPTFSGGGHGGAIHPACAAWFK